MTKIWPRIALGKVLEPISRPEPVEANKTYHILGAHWYAKGLYTKAVLSGSEIRASTVYRVEKDDFVYNRLFGWKGSFAVATAENHNCHVSNEFPCFLMDKARLDGQYLWYYFSRETIWGEALGLSSGGTPTSRNRLKEAKLLAMQIPLPPLDEQRRIVTRIEELAAKVEQARALRRQSAAEVDLLCRSIIFHTDGWEARRTLMTELVTLREPDVDVTPEETYHFAGVYSFGRGVFRGQSKRGSEFAYRKLSRLTAGTFVYPKLMAWEGAFGVVPPECDGLVVSPEFPVFEVNEDEVLPEVLDVHFKTPSVWTIIGELSTGTNVRRRRLHPRAFLSYEFPLPPMEVQLKLRQVKQKLAPVTDMQAATAARLDALLPSILDRAFRGEL